MTRLKVDEGSCALHVLADALSCTSVEAEEQISRLEAFTSFAGVVKTALGLDDLQDPISSFKSDGFKALKFYLVTDVAASTDGNVRIVACSAVRSFSYMYSLSLSLIFGRAWLKQIEPSLVPRQIARSSLVHGRSN